MLDHDLQLLQTAVVELRNTPGSGRGLFAKCNLKAGTHILTTSASLSPVAHVILRQYRREVCSHCFAYDRGKDWKIRIPQTALWFCSQTCLELWTNDYNQTRLEALRAAEASIQRVQRHHEDRMDVDSESTLTWAKASEIGRSLVAARSTSTPSKTDRKLLASYADGQADPDILNFLLSGCFMAASEPERLTSLRILEDNLHVYETASLEAHIRAYLQLLTLLPQPLLPHLRTDICHDLISRASHNAFSIRPSSDGEQSGEFLGYGVWPEASFFNHSCAPNISKQRIGRVWSFHVNRDIKAREELCITYLGGDERDLDVKGRRKRLQDEWGFACGCHACDSEAADKVDAGA